MKPGVLQRYCIRLLIVGTLFCSCGVRAEDVYEIRIAIRQHLFTPSIIHAPANRKIKLIISNLDDTAEEFESYPLNREKLIKGGKKVIVYVGPLEPGEYPFFVFFNPVMRKISKKTG